MFCSAAVGTSGSDGERCCLNTAMAMSVICATMVFLSSQAGRKR